MKRNSNYSITGKIDADYTKGTYTFTCKTVGTLFEFVLYIFTFIKSAFEQLEFSQFFTLVKCIWVVNHNSLKLEGICSISTSVHDNKLCKAYRKLKNCICAKCYAYNQQCRQSGLREHNILNGIILRNILIPVKAFKALSIVYPYLRIESFGDVANVIQARNYLRIIKAFPKKRCAIWSKNVLIWEQAIKEEGKPRNTTYVHSSRYINKPDNVSEYEFVDHVFTVYTREFATNNNVAINCGGRKCMECIKRRVNCYYRVNKHNNNYYINELLK